MSTLLCQMLVLVLAFWLTVIAPKAAHCASQVPCYFIFGDSLANPGNNNLLVTMAKANYQPYGVDFPASQATGRFTNNKTIVDILASRLGFSDYIPGFLSATGSQILKGVNYASGAAGIRDESGRNLGDRLTLKQQLFLYKITVSQLTILLKNRTAALNHLNKCIYTFQIGSNDYINNYFMPEFYTSSLTYTTAEFAKLVVCEYGIQLKELYENGARKVALAGVGSIGFVPYELGRYGVAGIPILNRAVEFFNGELKTLVSEFNTNFTDARFTFLNTTGISTNPNVTLAQLIPCCPIQANNMTCVPFNNSICVNRDQFLFFDNVHPTDIANQAVAARYYSQQDPTDVYPYDIQQLAQL